MRVNIYMPDKEASNLDAAKAAMHADSQSLSKIVLMLLKDNSGYWPKAAKKKKR